jgi:hypothetical protein
VQLLRECDGRIVVAQLSTSAGVLASKRNAVVDVQDAVGAAGGPDGSRGLDAVLFGVDLALFEGAAAREGGAGCLLGSVSERSKPFCTNMSCRGRVVTYGGSGILAEVVRRDEASRHSVVQTCPAVVGSIHNGVLETTRVREVQVQLAVLGFIRGFGAGANVRLELVEAIRNYLFVVSWGGGGGCGENGSLWWMLKVKVT